jgi:hypothetical protein
MEYQTYSCFNDSCERKLNLKFFEIVIGKRGFFLFELNVIIRIIYYITLPYNYITSFYTFISVVLVLWVYIEYTFHFLFVFVNPLKI